MSLLPGIAGVPDLQAGMPAQQSTCGRRERLVYQVAGERAGEAPAPLRTAPVRCPGAARGRREERGGRPAQRGDVGRGRGGAVNQVGQVADQGWKARRQRRPEPALDQCGGVGKGRGTGSGRGAARSSGARREVFEVGEGLQDERQHPQVLEGPPEVRPRAVGILGHPTGDPFQGGQHLGVGPQGEILRDRVEDGAVGRMARPGEGGDDAVHPGLPDVFADGALQPGDLGDLETAPGERRMQGAHGRINDGPRVGMGQGGDGLPRPREFVHVRPRRADAGGGNREFGVGMHGRTVPQARGRPVEAHGTTSHRDCARRPGRVGPVLGRRPGFGRTAHCARRAARHKRRPRPCRDVPPRRRRPRRSRRRPR